MQIAIDENNVRITAPNAKTAKKYTCPICGDEVILRQGSINIWHFAHKSSECVDTWNYDMSEWHLSMQNRFPEEQREVVISHNGKIHRADILKDDMIIEFQHSPISIDELRDRNLFYREAGYKVAWVFDFSEQYDIGAIVDYPRDDNTLMYKWRNPKRYLNCLPRPEEANKNIIIYFYWIDIDEEECINKIIWSTANDSNEPDFKRFIVDNYFFELDGELDVADFFVTEQDRLINRVASFQKPFHIKKSGVKSCTRETYICPKTNTFGIKKYGEQGCLYCKHCAAIKEYKKGFAAYCFFPYITREKAVGSPGDECSEAPRY